MGDTEQPDEIHSGPDTEPVPLSPVSRRERIASMDVLRGIAVFGIFLINMPLFIAPSAAFFNWENNPYWTSQADRLATLFVFLFAQGKFYTVFSFLFGLGFGVQLDRAVARRAPDFLSVYHRRLLILLVIGLLHFTLVWWGDVLHVYALLGFALIAIHDRSEHTILVWALCLTLIPCAAALIGTTHRHLTQDSQSAEVRNKAAERKARESKELAEDLRIYSSGSFVEILLFRLERDGRQLGVDVGWSIELFASFLLGLWAARRHIFTEPRRHLRLLKLLAGVALPAGFAIAVPNLLYAYAHPGETPPLWQALLTYIREFIARPAIAYGYVAILLLAGVRSWMSPLAAVGRMALTNYLLHSLVFTTIVNSYGLGLYGRIHPAQGLLLCVAFFAFQLVLSVWWLHRYAYGPVEWLWRTLTYGVRQPWMRSPLQTAD
ncbi:MAG TPA: DUF418 domain-containing protein [Bryobacteraceae bacterium]|nr:DUF418 domain-containing protein [Bryobacteraceae bacterium]